MERVQGIGGIFFKAQDPVALQQWYRDHLGLPVDDDRTVVFRWGGEVRGSTLWAPFPADTDYFAPSTAPFMINFRVENLDRMLAQLREAGARVDDRVEASEFGRFGWATDPEGNRFELWQPPAGW